MSDTPETDAFFMREDIDWDMEYDLCRKFERERDASKDNVRKLAVALADSIRFSLARQDETEQAMDECNELRILVDGLLDMNQKLSDERNLWMKEAERWRETKR